MFVDSAGPLSSSLPRSLASPAPYYPPHPIDRTALCAMSEVADEPPAAAREEASAEDGDAAEAAAETPAAAAAAEAPGAPDSGVAVFLRNPASSAAAAEALNSEERRWSSLLPEWMTFGRRKALSELLATEERYVADLKTLVEGYLNRLPAEVRLERGEARPATAKGRGKAQATAGEMRHEMRCSSPRSAVLRRQQWAVSVCCLRTWPPLLRWMFWTAAMHGAGEGSQGSPPCSVSFVRLLLSRVSSPRSSLVPPCAVAGALLQAKLHAARPADESRDALEDCKGEAAPSPTFILLIIVVVGSFPALVPALATRRKRGQQRGSVPCEKLPAAALLATRPAGKGLSLVLQQRPREGKETGAASLGRPPSDHPAPLSDPPTAPPPLFCSAGPLFFHL